MNTPRTTPDPFMELLCFFTEHPKYTELAQAIQTERTARMEAERDVERLRETVKERFDALNEVQEWLHDVITDLSDTDAYHNKHVKCGAKVLLTRLRKIA